MNYALQAMDTNKSMINDNELTITVGDKTAIESIMNDESIFTSAGMDTANKAVCAQILQVMDAEARLISSTTLCAWDYICDYSPHYLFMARCKTSMCSGSCSQGGSKQNMCQSHGIHMTVLQRRGDCGEWVLGQELLPIACTCMQTSSYSYVTTLS